MKQILFDKCNFVYDNKPISGPNVIVILENEWVNKNGWVKGRGMGLYLEKILLYLMFLTICSIFSPCKINSFAAGGNPPPPLCGKFLDNNLL